MKVQITAEADNDFKKGDCRRCPFHYAYALCPLVKNDKNPNDCPIEIVKDSQWIPFKYRKMTDEEKESYSTDYDTILDCELPEEGQPILVSDGKSAWEDFFMRDGDLCYLDVTCDIEEGMAWMPMPEPYKKD
jgi:hypothetical protein